MRIIDILLIIVLSLGYYISGGTAKINGWQLAKEPNQIGIHRVKDTQTAILDENLDLRIVDKKQ